MPGLVDCGVVLRTALPSGNAFFTSFKQKMVNSSGRLPKNGKMTPKIHKLRIF